MIMPSVLAEFEKSLKTNAIGLLRANIFKLRVLLSSALFGRHEYFELANHKLCGFLLLSDKWRISNTPQSSSSLNVRIFFFSD